MLFIVRFTCIFLFFLHPGAAYHPHHPAHIPPVYIDAKISGKMYVWDMDNPVNLRNLF